MAHCRLVALSKPYDTVDVDTAEELIAYCARVSNPANQNNKKTAAKLIQYLIENDHWSPLEMVSMTIEINTTRDIARQILRHRSFSFQEFSQRYAEVLDFASPRETRIQDKKNRQNSLETDDIVLDQWWHAAQTSVINITEKHYKAALHEGIAKEQARAILPEGLTNSTLYMAGTLRSWIHYCQLRMANGTQKEHAEIAELCWAIISEHFPAITSIFIKDPIDELIEAFTEALEKKLRATDDQMEWLAGINQPLWPESVKQKLVQKAMGNDPLDTAAYCAVAWSQGWEY